MPSICFLVATRGAARNDNHQRLPAAFAAAGWRVSIADHHDLRLAAGTLRLAADGTPLANFDRIWPIGLGERASFLDRMELLSTLPRAQFIVAPEVLLQLHAKYSLPLGPLAEHHPETYAARDPEWLATIVMRGGEWIAKPAAASFGRHVYRLNRDDANLYVVLDALTGNDGTEYCLLQRYVPEITAGEKRVLIAGAQIVATYLRVPSHDHRANLAADANARPATLDAREMALAERCATYLDAHGAGFAAVDIAYPWIIEFNVANPGGLQTLERLTGTDYAPAVVEALTAPRRSVASPSNAAR